MRALSFRISEGGVDARGLSTISRDASPARRGRRKRCSRSPAGTQPSAGCRAAAPATSGSIPRARGRRPALM
jgi:hypothetical protein